MSTTLNVVWYNIRGLKNKRSGVVAFLESSPEVDVLMLQESSCRNEGFKTSFSRQLEMVGCMLICNNVTDRVMAIVRRASVQEYRVLLSNDRVQVIEVASGELSVKLVNHYGSHKEAPLCDNK